MGDIYKHLTDWDNYYDNPFFLSQITRKISSLYLIKALGKLYSKTDRLNVMEYGGANSCFYLNITNNFNVERYYIVDTNETGLKKTQEKFKNDSRLELIKSDLFIENYNLPKADIIFSFGLIEHFSPEETKVLIKTHFTNLSRGGTVIIGFPTPTLLYRLVRRTIEICDKWAFPDERPIEMSEVIREVGKFGQIVHHVIIWPILLTQGLIVISTR